MNCRKGAVLSLVLGILLAISFMASALLYLPGGVERNARRRTTEMQSVYAAESALLAHLRHLPEGFLRQPPWGLDLPKVERESFGPWQRLSAVLPEAVMGKSRVSVLAGRSLRELSSADRWTLGERFRQTLNREILMSDDIQVKQGNRRFLGAIRSMSLLVENGDLLLDGEGDRLSINAKVEGMAEIRGTLQLDTLRVYSRGPLRISGTVNVDWLEAFSEDVVEFGRECIFSGVAVGRNLVVFRQKSRAEFPAAVFSQAGTVESGAGALPVKMLLPAFDESDPLEVIEWRLE